MKPEEIMDAARGLYNDAGTIMSTSAARNAARKAASLIFYLAKLHASSEGVKHGLKGPPPYQEVEDVSDEQALQNRSQK